MFVQRNEDSTTTYNKSQHSEYPNTACCRRRALHHNQPHSSAHGCRQPNIPGQGKMIKEKDDESGRAPDLIAA